MIKNYHEEILKLCQSICDEQKKANQVEGYSDCDMQFVIDYGDLSLINAIYFFDTKFDFYCGKNRAEYLYGLIIYEHNYELAIGKAFHNFDYSLNSSVLKHISKLQELLDSMNYENKLKKEKDNGKVQD